LTESQPATFSSIPRSPVVVGVSEYRVCCDPMETVVTYALGSCLGVAIWDRQQRFGGILHYMLPLSSVNPERARLQPAMFGDSGLPLFLNEFFKRNSRAADLVIRLAGGASMPGQGGNFEIGKRNALLAKRLLWKNNLSPMAEDIGGTKHRTLRLELATGVCKVKNEQEEYEI
jgi:chemotaxis protein CheD